MLLLPMMTSATLLATSLDPGYTSIDLIQPNVTVYFRPFYGSPIEDSANTEFQKSDMFLNASVIPGDYLQAVTGSSSDPTVAMYWTLLSDTSDANGYIYKIYNSKYDVYIASATNGNISFVSNADQAGQYYIKAGTDTAYKKSGSYDETFDLTKYVYFQDVSTGKGLEANCSTRNAGQTGPFTVTAGNLADNGNAYYTVLQPTVDINNATDNAPLGPEYTSIDLIAPNETFFFRPFYGTTVEGTTDSEFQSTDCFLIASSTAGSKLTWAKGDASDPTTSMYWTLVPASDSDDGVYNLYNEKYNVYMSPAPSSTNVTMVATQAEAGRYNIKAGERTFSRSGNTYNATKYVYFWDVDNGTAFDANASAKSSNTAVNGWTLGYNSYFTVVVPTTDIDDATETSAIYLPNRDVYIQTNNSSRPYLSVRISGFDNETSTCKYQAQATTDSYLEASIWNIIPSEVGADGTQYYKIYNPATKRYVSSSTSDNTLVTEESAGLFLIDETSGKTVFKYKDDTSYCLYLNNNVLSANTSSTGFTLCDVKGSVNSDLTAVVTPTTNKNVFIVSPSDSSKILTFNANRKAKPVVRMIQFLKATGSETTDSVVGLHSAWMFKPAPVDNTYYIYNEQRELYVGKTDTKAACQEVAFVPSEAEAGMYKLVAPEDGSTTFTLKDTNNKDYGYIIVMNDLFKNSPIVGEWYALSTAKNMAYKSIAPLADVIISPQSMGNEGFTNLYSDFNKIICEKVDNIWDGVWTLRADNRYPRNDRYGNQNFDLLKEGGDTSNDADYYGPADYVDLVYNIYNRVSKLFLAVDDKNNVTTTTDQAQAVEVKFILNAADNNNSVTMQIYKPTATTSDGKTTYNNADLDAGSKLYFVYDKQSKELKVGEGGSSDDNIFNLREATNTSYDAITDGAQIELYPYRMQSYNKKIYAIPSENKLYREAGDDDTDHGAYCVLTLIKCKPTDAHITNGESSSAPRRAESTDAEETVDLTDTYYVYSEISKMYLGQVCLSTYDRGYGQTIPLVADKVNAGRYRFCPDAYQLDAIVAYDIDSSNSAKYFNCSVTSTGYDYSFVNYACEEDNRLFFVNNLKEIPTSVMDDIYDGALIQLTPWEYLGDSTLSSYSENGGKVYYDDDNKKITCGKTDNITGVDEMLYTWKLVAAKDATGNVIADTYYLVNVKTGEYMSSTGYADDHGGIMTTIASTNGEIPADAACYKFIPDPQSGLYVSLLDNNSISGGQGRYLQNVLTDNNEKLGWSTKSTSLNLSATDGTTAVEKTYTDPETGLTTTTTINKKNYLYSSLWYYIKPITISTSFDKDVIDWALANLDPDNGRTVGYFDALESTGYPGNTGYTGKLITRELVSSTTDEETGLVVNTYKYSWKDNATEDDLTFEQLVNLVQYYYQEYEAGNLTNPTDQAAANAAYNALLTCIQDEEYIVHPRIGRFYTIRSAFPYFSELKLRETYYMEHHDKMQGTQKVHFHREQWDPEIVSSFWRFDVQPYDENNNYEDPDAHHYFFIRAVNSRDVMRKSAAGITVDVRSDADKMNVGLYALRKDYSLNVYPGSVLLRSYTNNTNRTYTKTGSFLGMWTDEENVDRPTDAIVREGSDSRVKPTIGRPAKNANNWYIEEIKKFTITFIPETEPGSGVEGEKPHCNNHDDRYFNTFCFPFNVKLPTTEFMNSDDVQMAAYTGIAQAADGTVDLTKMTDDHVGAYTDEEGRLIVKAFHPFILAAKCESAELEIVYGPGEEYGLYNRYESSLTDKYPKYTKENWAEICKKDGIPATSTDYETNYGGLVTKARRNGNTADNSTSTESASVSEWSMTSIDSLEPVGDAEAGKSNSYIAANRYKDSGMLGAISPVAIENEDTEGYSTAETTATKGTVYYALHDDNDDKVSEIKPSNYATASAASNDDLVWSYVSDNIHEDYGVPNGSLPGSVSTYVVSANTAVLVGLSDNLDINDQPITSGVEEVTTEIVNEPGRDANGNLIYFDLYGRRVMNPAPGIYILTNGQKVVVR
jgi:hypothetical protein